MCVCVFVCVCLCVCAYISTRMCMRVFVCAYSYSGNAINGRLVRRTRRVLCPANTANADVLHAAIVHHHEKALQSNAITCHLNWLATRELYARGSSLIIIGLARQNMTKIELLVARPQATQDKQLLYAQINCVHHQTDYPYSQAFLHKNWLCRSKPISRRAELPVNVCEPANRVPIHPSQVLTCMHRRYVARGKGLLVMRFELPSHSVIQTIVRALWADA